MIVATCRAHLVELRNKQSTLRIVRAESNCVSVCTNLIQLVRRSLTLPAVGRDRSCEWSTYPTVPHLEGNLWRVVALRPVK